MVPVLSTIPLNARWAPSPICIVPGFSVTGVWLKTKSLAVTDAASTPYSVIVSLAPSVMTALPLASSAMLPWMSAKPAILSKPIRSILSNAALKL